MKNNSRVIKNRGFQWDDVPVKAYKTEGTHFKDITRHALLGEGPDDGELTMHTRYFEIKPGGYSSLEIHRHPHTVLVIRGKGSVVLNDTITDLDLHDVVFVSPETIHQFHADKDDYLGFVCVVDRYRDKPTIPNEAQIERLVGQGAARKKIRV